MIVGSFGDCVFEVSNLKVTTFDGFKRETKAIFQEHKIINNPAVLEFLGRELETISFTAIFHAALGVVPFEEVHKFREMCWRGEANFLIIGNHAYTENPMVITSLSENVQHWSGNGKHTVAKMDCTLKEYIENF